MINSNLEIQKFLEKIPASSEIIHISIIGEIPLELSEDYIRMVSVVNKNLYYYKDDLEKKFTCFVGVQEETFEEAKKRVDQASNENE